MIKLNDSKWTAFFMNQIQRLEKYIADFFSTRYPDFDWYYKTTHQHRQHGIYNLKEGPKLMDHILGIHANIEDHLIGGPLIPQKFVTPAKLFSFLNAFKVYLEENHYLLEQNFAGTETDEIVTRLQTHIEDLLGMIDYAKQTYELEDTRIPYQDLRYALITRNIADFVSILKSILASVSYAITKSSEGFHHSNVHLILKLLGFDILAEETTNNGRIDAVIWLMDLIYIIEFKFSAGSDQSAAALNQIKAKEYADKFLIEKKEIIGIGVSFDQSSKNINGYKTEQLNATSL